jgi:hypothetical protein
MLLSAENAKGAMTNSSSLAVIFGAGLLLVTSDVHAVTNLFTGVTVYDYPDTISGKLAMLLASTEGDKAPSDIITFDLKSKALRKVASAPQFGVFTVSDDGKLFCVRDNEYQLNEPKAFLYSDRMDFCRTVTLPKGPQCDALVGDCAFFLIEWTNGTRIVQLDIETGRQHFIRMPGTNVWEHEDFPDIWGLPVSNILQFEYRAYRHPRSDIRNRLSGIFSYNVATETIEAVSGMSIKPNDEVSANGRYIFFHGPDAPVAGLKLVSSPVSHSDLEDVDAKIRRDVKVVKRFVHRRLHQYWLLGLSPDKKYAFVQEHEAVEGHSALWVYYYHAVDVANGKTWTLLKDEYELKTGRRMYQCVYWVGAP